MKTFLTILCSIALTLSATWMPLYNAGRREGGKVAIDEIFSKIPIHSSAVIVRCADKSEFDSSVPGAIITLYKDDMPLLQNAASIGGSIFVYGNCFVNDLKDIFVKSDKLRGAQFYGEPPRIDK